MSATQSDNAGLNDRPALASAGFLHRRVAAWKDKGELLSLSFGICATVEGLCLFFMSLLRPFEPFAGWFKVVAVLLLVIGIPLIRFGIYCGDLSERDSALTHDQRHEMRTSVSSLRTWTAQGIRLSPR